MNTQKSTLSRALKLKADDEEGLTVFSALLQDAIVPVIGMTHHPKESIFSLLSYRFRREKKLSLHRKDSLHERVMCLINIHHVLAAQTKGLKDFFNPNQHLNLLCIRPQKNHMRFIFSQDIEVLLTIEKIFALLGDQKAHWPTSFVPVH